LVVNPEHPIRFVRRVRTGVVVTLAVVVGVCVSMVSLPAGAATTTFGSPPAIPASAFKNHTGLTSKSVTIGNISTQSSGLFTGAKVGTEAYAAYVNSLGGVNGRKLIVDAENDQFEGAPNKSETQSAVENDFAAVGSFSLEDSFGETVLAANPGFANVSVALSQSANDLPNTFSVSPVRYGWQLGGLAYFKKLYPSDITKTGAILSSLPSAQKTWSAEKQAMDSLGYKVIQQPTYNVLSTDFTQTVVAMKNAGVRILFLEQLPQNYAGAVIQDLHQQNYHPVVVLGTGGYSESFVSSSGGASNADGIWLLQDTALYLGEDASALPADKTFLHWVQAVSPGFKADLYTFYGWLSGELFTQALKAAGSDPSRGSVLQQLRKITTFTGGGLVGNVNPANKVPSNCYIIARVVNGKFQRHQDPPITGATHGFRCDAPYFYAK
jgi:ABC-type branched-subunit amino acid transport system substrate-binding protein